MQEGLWGSRAGLGRGRSGLCGASVSHLPILPVLRSTRLLKLLQNFSLNLAEPFSYMFLGEDGAVGLSGSFWGCEAEVSSAHFRSDQSNSLVPGPTPHAEGPPTLPEWELWVQITLLKLRLKAKRHLSNTYMAQSLTRSPPQPLPCPQLPGAMCFQE